MEQTNLYSVCSVRCAVYSVYNVYSVQSAVNSVYSAVCVVYCVDKITLTTFFDIKCLTVLSCLIKAWLRRLTGCSLMLLFDGSDGSDLAADIHGIDTLTLLIMYSMRFGGKMTPPGLLFKSLV